MPSRKERVELRKLFASQLKRLPSGCLIWTGTTTGSENPAFTIPGRTRPVSARRWIWLDEGHTDPGASPIKNRCRKSLCINPACSYIASQEVA